MPAPLLSVILVCKNPGPRLADALASVWAQRSAAPEIIVFDGVSSDGSLAWLEAHRDRLAHFSSAPDRSVYDAMNRAVAVARGEWLLFLGADDQLANDTVLASAASTLQNTSAAVVSGEAVYADGRIYRFDPGANAVARNFVHHQATFYRRALFTDHGNFDLSFTLLADYEFNLRLVSAHAVFAALPVRIATCGPGGLSDSGRWRGYAEEIRARHRHFPAWRCWFWDALSVLRFGRKQILRALTRAG